MPGVSQEDPTDPRERREEPKNQRESIKQIQCAKQVEYQVAHNVTAWVQFGISFGIVFGELAVLGDRLKDAVSL